MTEDQRNALQTAFDLGVSSAGPQMPDERGAGAPYLLMPNQSRVQNLEPALPAPTRIRECLTFTQLKSFIDYINAFKRASTMVFASVSGTAATFEAVLDYSSPQDGPEWGQHVAHYACPLTEEWGRWQVMDNKECDQTTFAEFIEENIADIHTPPGAKMLEIARSLAAKSEVVFERAVRLDNGDVQFKYQQMTDARAGERGELTIPEMMRLGLPVFEGGIRYAVDARFRYRITGQALRLKFHLVNPHLVIRKCVEDICAMIEEKTKIGPFYGSRQSTQPK